MSADYVLDASVVLAWMLNSQATRATDALLQRAGELTFVAPRHLAAEVRNGLLKGERMGRVQPAETELALEILDGIDLRYDAVEGAARLHATVALARAHAVSFYDALYVELARSGGLRLASRDRRQLDAASACGVEVYDALGGPE